MRRAVITDNNGVEHTVQYASYTSVTEGIYFLNSMDDKQKYVVAMFPWDSVHHIRMYDEG